MSQPACCHRADDGTDGFTIGLVCACSRHWADVVNPTLVRCRHGHRLEVGLLSGLIGIWSAFNWQPDVGPLSACPSTRCRVAATLVGHQTSARCRHARRLTVGPMSDLIGIWSANRHRFAVGIIRGLADGLMSGLIGIWSACLHWPTIEPTAIPRPGRYRLPP